MAAANTLACEATVGATWLVAQSDLQASSPKHADVII